MHIISFILLLIVSMKLITFGWNLKLVYNSTLLWTENKLPELLTIDASHQISNLSLAVGQIILLGNPGVYYVIYNWALEPAGYPVRKNIYYKDTLSVKKIYVRVYHQTTINLKTNIDLTHLECEHCEWLVQLNWYTGHDKLQCYFACWYIIWETINIVHLASLKVWQTQCGFHPWNTAKRWLFSIH